MAPRRRGFAEENSTNLLTFFQQYGSKKTLLQNSLSLALKISLNNGTIIYQPTEYNFKMYMAFFAVFFMNLISISMERALSKILLFKI